MEAVLLLIFLLPVFGYLGLNELRKKRVRQAYDFNPRNAHGGARFATNDDLRKAGLL